MDLMQAHVGFNDASLEITAIPMEIGALIIRFNGFINQLSGSMVRS